VKGEKILLLDDNKDLLLILQIILKGQGYETISAASVDEAMQKIKIHTPALILMDVFIYDQDGRELCRQLKMDPSTHNIRIIMMSGCDATLGLMTNTDADDFMQKPFNYDDLLTRIENQMMMVTAA
jgi:DNA-binding response OmpR family regulator